MSKSWENVLSNVVNNLCSDNDILGIILHGSYALGNYHKYSDIDLYVITNTKGNCTSLFYHDDYPVQIIWRTLEEFKEKVMKPTRNKGIANIGNILFDRTGIITLYIKKAKKVLTEPKTLTNFEKELMVIELSTELQTIKGLIESSNVTGAILLINELAITGINVLYDYHKWFMVSNKHLVSDLKQHDTYYGELLEKIILESDINNKYYLLETLVNNIFRDCNIRKITEYDISYNH